jgi:hypothetical protein
MYIQTSKDLELGKLGRAELIDHFCCVFQLSFGESSSGDEMGGIRAGALCCTALHSFLH